MSRSSFDPPKYKSVHDVVMELVQQDSDTDSYITLFQQKVGTVFAQVAINRNLPDDERDLFVRQGTNINKLKVQVDYYDNGQCATITVEPLSDIRGTASALNDAVLTLTLLRNRPEFSIETKSESLGWRRGIKCVITIKKL